MGFVTIKFFTNKIVFVVLFFSAVVSTMVFQNCSDVKFNELEVVKFECPVIQVDVASNPNKDLGVKTKQSVLFSLPAADTFENIIWHMPDGRSVQNKEANFTFDEVGTFFVGVEGRTIAVDEKGCKATFAQSVPVNVANSCPDLSTIKIEGPSKASAKQEVQFSALVLPCMEVATHAWKFGDNDDSNGLGRVVNHRYQLPGTFTVQLTSAPKVGKSTATTTFAITITPAENFYWKDINPSACSTLICGQTGTQTVDWTCWDNIQEKAATDQTRCDASARPPGTKTCTQPACEDCIDPNVVDPKTQRPIAIQYDGSIILHDVESSSACNNHELQRFCRQDPAPNAPIGKNKLTGDDKFKYLNCTPTTIKSCTFTFSDGGKETVEGGKTLSVFEKPHVLNNETCKSETLTCNGTTGDISAPSFRTSAKNCTPCEVGQVVVNGQCVYTKFEVSGKITNGWDTQSPAKVSGCSGKTATVDSSGNFKFTDVNYGTICSNIGVTRTGANCRITSTLPTTGITSNLSNVAGECVNTACPNNATNSPTCSVHTVSGNITGAKEGVQDIYLCGLQYKAAYVSSTGAFTISNVPYGTKCGITVTTNSSSSLYKCNITWNSPEIKGDVNNVSGACTKDCEKSFDDTNPILNKIPAGESRTMNKAGAVENGQTCQSKSFACDGSSGTLPSDHTQYKYSQCSTCSATQRVKDNACVEIPTCGDAGATNATEAYGPPSSALCGKNSVLVGEVGLHLKDGKNVYYWYCGNSSSPSEQAGATLCERKQGISYPFTCEVRFAELGEFTTTGDVGKMIRALYCLLLVRDASEQAPSASQDAYARPDLEGVLFWATLYKGDYVQITNAEDFVAEIIGGAQPNTPDKVLISDNDGTKLLTRTKAFVKSIAGSEVPFDNTGIPFDSDNLGAYTKGLIMNAQKVSPSFSTTLKKMFDDTQPGSNSSPNVDLVKVIYTNYFDRSYDSSGGFGHWAARRHPPFKDEDRYYLKNGSDPSLGYDKTRPNIFPILTKMLSTKEFWNMTDPIDGKPIMGNSTDSLKKEHDLIQYLYRLALRRVPSEAEITSWQNYREKATDTASPFAIAVNSALAQNFPLDKKKDLYIKAIGFFFNSWIPEGSTTLNEFCTKNRAACGYNSINISTGRRP